MINQEHIDLIKQKCTGASFDKLTDLDNEELMNFIARYVEHCNPDSIFVRTDSPEDNLYLRNKAVENGEEKALKIKGHTIHFDGPADQARDKKNTKYFTSTELDLDPSLNLVDREEGFEEIYKFLKDSMVSKEMYICFFCLGPVDSPFTVLAVQITDSAYVAHSESILYRSGYEEFKKEAEEKGFFKFVHSAGELENGVSREVDKRRVYIDLDNDIVYSTNTQYAGNTVGLKKLSLRLAIKKAAKEGWLAEHMFVMGVNGPGRKTYFTGAFPSACGKTSTAMIPGETIIGDDIAYLRSMGGVIRGVNVETGIFGIIKDVNIDGDPVIWEALTSEGEVIFSNILMDDNGGLFWLGDGREAPESGVNFSGQWQAGKKDAAGNDIPYAHKNARYTVSLKALGNVDDMLDEKEGVEVSGIVYGGRDSHTTVPVQEAFGWEHGVLTMGAALESETTAATLGKEGVRTFNLMSNIDFISLPLGKYISNYIQFARGLKKTPSVFMVNYFLTDDNGKYLNSVADKRVWMQWAERRIHGEVEAIKTPSGNIPLYEDLKKLFYELLNKDYSKEAYTSQFTLRVPENIAKLDRIMEIYKKHNDIPEELFSALESQKRRFLDFKSKYGEYVAPEALREAEGVCK